MLISVLWPLLFALAQHGGTRWPPVQPLTVRAPVDFSADKIVIDVPLRDQAGRVLYYFGCRGGSERYLDSVGGNWVGPLMCTLAEGGEPSDTSLLSEDDSAAWFSRGQFRREELVGDCAKYPDFGLHRSFRLRGFRLRLDAEDVKSNSGGASSFVLRLSVASDPTATTQRAERPGFLDPRREGAGCGVIVPGREPLMCRDEAGSFGVCKL
jgi:hypothetical protein